jgi:CubicO group peptidase (beta-lactamase class C family)
MVFPKKEFNKISCKEAFVDKHDLIHMFDEMIERELNIHQMMLLHEGSMLVHMALDSFKDVKEKVYSVSKSFTSMAIGILIDQGLLDLDDYILFYFSDDLKKYKDGYEKIKLRHLLTMSSGQEKDRFYGLTPQHDPIEIFFNTELKYEPGQHFSYSNFDSLILSAIVTKVTGMTMHDFLKVNLYEKIGLEDIEWTEFAGYTLGCTGLKLSVKDMARFGLLLLNKGKWNDEQIISKAYIEMASSKQIDTSHVTNDFDKHGYGFQFWMNSFGGFRAAGLYNQHIIVHHDYDLVFALIAYEERDLTRLFPDYILKAFSKGWKMTQLSLKDAYIDYKNKAKDMIKEEERTRKY